MAKIYFVRHARPDFSNHDDYSRPLTEEGLKDCKKVTEFLQSRSITKIFSSPYKRSFDTIRDFAESVDLKIDIIDDFRERKVNNGWIEDFNVFTKEQWGDFDYKLSDGESLWEVQKRNIAALQEILLENRNMNIAIGTHGTALSTIINYFDNKFDYNEFQRIKNIMPFIACIEFENSKFVKIEKFLV